MLQVAQRRGTTHSAEDGQVPSQVWRSCAQWLACQRAKLRSTGRSKILDSQSFQLAKCLSWILESRREPSIISLLNTHLNISTIFPTFPVGSHLSPRRGCRSVISVGTSRTSLLNWCHRAAQWNTPLMSAQEAHHEFEASLIYIASCSPSRVTYEILSQK